jgi:hypothetical protein
VGWILDEWVFLYEVSVMLVMVVVVVGLFWQLEKKGGQGSASS